VTLSGRSFGLDVLAAREGSSNAILGGYAAGELLADSVAVVGASVVAAVRVRPADERTVITAAHRPPGALSRTGACPESDMTVRRCAPPSGVTPRNN